MPDSESHDYELIDCGSGRRLERFGKLIVDRPAPVAVWPKALSKSEWQSDLYYDHVRTGGDRRGTTDSSASSSWKGSTSENWSIRFDSIRFGLQTLGGGQLGVFPEQQNNWQWLVDILPQLVKEKQKQSGDDQPLRILNLFAYTGGSTLAALSVDGVEVCHLDSARPSVEMAKQNAILSRLQDKPVRWMVDDAMAFCERELRREKMYDGVILDPPAFGRGKGGKVWKLSQNLPKLMAVLSKLLVPKPALVLLTAHDPKFPPEAMRKSVDSLLAGRCGTTRIETGSLTLQSTSTTGNTLPLGDFARWSFFPAAARIQ